MSWHDYYQSKQVAAEDYPFYSLIMAAYRRADSRNQQILELAYPNTVKELQDRYDAPGGYLPGEEA